MGSDQFGRFGSFCLFFTIFCHTLLYLDCNFKATGIKMSLHGRMFGEKIGREDIKGSHQWNSAVIHIGIFFCVQQLSGKGGKQ